MKARRLGSSRTRVSREDGVSVPLHSDRISNTITKERVLTKRGAREFLITVHPDICSSLHDGRVTAARFQVANIFFFVTRPSQAETSQEEGTRPHVLSNCQLDL